MENTQYASLFIEDLGEGGGLADDFDFTVTGSKAVNHDFGAAKGGVRPCWEVTMDAEGYDEPVITYYSVGKATEWMPAPDANGFTPMLNADQLVSKNSNVGQLVIQLQNSGFPSILLKEKGLSAIIGAKGHAKRIPVENRPDGADAKDSRGQKPKMLLPTAITYFEGMDGTDASARTATTTTTKGKGKAKGHTVQQAADSLANMAVDVISALLKTESNGIAKGDLARKIFSYAQKNKVEGKNEIMSLATTDEFLSDGPWVYENGIVKPIG